MTRHCSRPKSGCVLAVISAAAIVTIPACRTPSAPSTAMLRSLSLNPSSTFAAVGTSVQGVVGLTGPAPGRF